MGIRSSRTKYIQHHLDMLSPFIDTIRDCEGQGVNKEVVRYSFIVEWEEQPTDGLRLTVADLKEKFPHMGVLSKKSWKTQKKRTTWC